MSEIVAIGDALMNAFAALNQHASEIKTGVGAIRSVGTGYQLVAPAVKNFRAFLTRHYEGASDAAKEKAAENVAKTASRVGSVFDDYVASGRLTEDAGRAAFDDPAFALYFTRAMSDASETSSDQKQEMFARLVVERMTHTVEDAKALIIGMATRRLKEIGDRQLRLLAAIFVVKYIYVDNFETLGSIDLDYDYFAEQCAIELRPFWDTQVIEQDLDHLAIATLLSRSDAQLKVRMIHVGPNSSCLMLHEAQTKYVQQMQTAPKEVFAKLHAFMVGAGNRQIAFNFVTLTSAGWILGAVVYSHMRGVPLDLGKWE